MANRCAGCTNKFKFLEKPSICPECHRTFCNLCLPVSKGKKSMQKVATCVYCSQKQKQLNQTEEAEIMDNFQERYYKRTHREAPIQTKLRLDYSKTSGGGGGSPQTQPKAAPLLSEEDQKLEERLRKLKESHKPSTPTYSADEMAEKLSKLRGEEPNTHKSPAEEGSTQPHSDTPADDSTLPSNITQADQAHNLIEQTAEEVKMDQRLDETNQKRDKDMLNRLQLLKGKKADSSDQSPKSHQLDPEMQNLLETMDIQITEDDPEMLLEDLRKFQAKQEESALMEAQSSDIQNLVQKARKLAQEDNGEDSPATTKPDGADIPYTTPYPVVDTVNDEADNPSKVNQAEISKLLVEAKDAIEQDKQRKSEDEAFMKASSDRLTELRKTKTDNDDEDGDIVVRSKLDPSTGLGAYKSKTEETSLGTKKNLDFTWAHFGASAQSNNPTGPITGPSAARELGIIRSGSFASGRDEDIEEDAQELLKKMIAEAALDEKLEASGYDRYIDKNKKTDSKESDVSSTTTTTTTTTTKPGGASIGAAAVGYWGGGSDGGDSDDLPWCCICNDNAAIRCFDCDNDLYCTRCFSEGHQQFGLFDHRYGPFEPPTKKVV